MGKCSCPGWGLLIVIGQMSSFLTEGGLQALTTPPVLGALAAITRSRNAAAHADSLDRDHALRVKGEVLAVLSALLPEP